MTKFIIIAPHADDEVIGCYAKLARYQVAKVLFPNKPALIEASDSSEHFKFGRQLIADHKYSDKYVYLFPDPIYETHPLHRELGSDGERLLRAGLPVIFYTTNMLAPYIHEVKEADKKRDSLYALYSYKSKLWEYEHKYFLFEGYNAWLL